MSRQYDRNGFPILAPSKRGEPLPEAIEETLKVRYALEDRKPSNKKVKTVESVDFYPSRRAST